MVWSIAARSLTGVVGALWLCSCNAGTSGPDGGLAAAAAAPSSPGPSAGIGGSAPLPKDGGTVAPVGGSSAQAGSGAVSDASTVGIDAGSDAAPALDASAVMDAAASANGSDAAALDAGPEPIARPNEIHGVNWADQRDNFVNGPLQLSGLNSSTDTYDTVQQKTTQIVGQFRDKLGANTIRIPINEPTLSSPWWDAYKAVIDTTTAMGMNVIVAYWAYRGGQPADEAAFKAMWQKVVDGYADNNRVFFDIHNEPSGLGSRWRDEAARWLGYFPDLPRSRIIVAGLGSDDQIVPVGSDARFDGCILEFHYYTFWHKDWTTQKQWRDGVSQAIGSYASRTIVGEWGAVMTSGLDYNTNTPDGDNTISYITAMADFIREHEMGSVYWPGLRDDDTYSLMKRDPGAGSAIDLSITNASGLDRLRWSWGL